MQDLADCGNRNGVKFYSTKCSHQLNFMTSFAISPCQKYLFDHEIFKSKHPEFRELSLAPRQDSSSQSALG